ncbi:MAG: AAA family ATPase, partial [Muribaculum sp.]|nr:AAA family ATPase [Muribaculum sp.]
GMPNLTSKGYNLLRDHITDLWGKQVNKDLREFKGKPFYELAINYLTYKTLKISLYYRHHNEPFKLISTMTDVYNSELIEDMINSESADLSHITRKIHQTLGYLLYDVYSEELSVENLFIDSSNLGFNRINELWVRNVLPNLTKKQPRLLESQFQVAIARQAIVPPPFLKSKINLHEKSDESIQIIFETLSSGEKQQAYAVSSILYHFDNLNSVKDDKSAPLRIPYKNILLILEEIELYFHPELQQEFMKHLLDGIKQLELDNIKNIHLLLVTHSPYVLSDIPKENVLALTENGIPEKKKLKTFCANIHEMLKDSFFLSHGCQGEFARWEIGHIMACLNIHRLHRKNEVSNSEKVVLPIDDEVYKFLERYQIIAEDYKSHIFSYDDFCKDFSEEQLRMRINVIDEPLIRSVLTRELNEVFQKTEEEILGARIMELEEELRKLREDR